MSVNISIIMPCYNGECFVAVAIESVVRQEREDIELIIVDDGSSDNTRVVCEKYVTERVRYIRTDNMGAGHARNVGMDSARGKWISFLDCDDVYLAKSFDDEFVSKLLLYEDCNVDIICTPRLRNNMELMATTEILFPENVNNIRNNMPVLAFCTCIYRRDFLVNYNIRFYEYQKQDIETAFRYLAFSNAKKVENNNGLVFYLQRDNLLSNTHTWNHYNLYEIKAKVYYDLYERTVKEEDKFFLIETSILSIVSYYKLSLKRGHFTEEGMSEVYLLLEKVRGEYKKIGKDVALKCKMWVMHRTWKILRLRKARIFERKRLPNAILDVADVMKRLESVSEDIKKRVRVGKCS